MNGGAELSICNAVFFDLGAARANACAEQRVMQDMQDNKGRMYPAD